MAPMGTDESHRPVRPYEYGMNPFKFENFNVCRLMADKAMHDLDYKAQLERSAHAHNNAVELAELNMEIEKGMSAMRKRRNDDERWKLRRQAFDVGEYLDLVNSRPETVFTGTASSHAGRALALLAAEQRIQSDPHPFQFMKLPAEIRDQIYRELFIGEGRTIVVSADKALSLWSRSCKIEGGSAFGKDITTALLRTNKRIYNEALPVLYQTHTFDFGVDVLNIEPFFSQTSSAARQNVHGIHMELLRYGTDRPLREVLGRQAINDTGYAWSDACKYICSHLQVKEISFNIDFAIRQDFQRFRWVGDLARIRVSAISHHNSPNEHSLKTADLPSQQKSPHDWGTDEYRLEVLLEYLRSKMLR